MDGGALTWDSALNVKSVIERIMAEGSGRMVALGTVGVVLQLASPSHLPFLDTATRTKVSKIVVKVIPLHPLMTSKIDLKGSTENEVREEFKKQTWLDRACIKKYGFSIFPTPIQLEFTTLFALAVKFPFFGKVLNHWRVKRDCRIGVIFMEMVSSQGQEGTMDLNHHPRENPLGRRLLHMLATLGFVHGDFHKGNFFQSGRGYVIGDLGESRSLTKKEKEVLADRESSKRDIINVLYGRYNPMRDFTSQYYHPVHGDPKYNGYVKNYQWVRTDAKQLSTAIDDVEFATVDEVKHSLGYRRRVR